MALDLLFSCISIMLSDFSGSMLVEFPRISVCQKILMWWIKINQYNIGGGGWGYSRGVP